MPDCLLHRGVLLFVSVLACVPLAVAARADDLDLIPDAVLSAPAEQQGEPPGAEAGPPGAALAPPSTPAVDAERRGRLFLEWLPQATHWRTPVLPMPGGGQAGLSQRLALDGRGQWELAPALTFTLSDRIGLEMSDRRPVFDRDTTRNELREAFVTWAGDDGVFLQAGRVNLRNGVAVGFNPTDFFKTGAVVSRTTEDPSVQRTNRLGTLVARAEMVGAAGAAAFTMAPGLGQADRRWWSDARAYGLALHRTNRDSRWLADVTWTLADDVSPQVLLYRDDGGTRLGLNLTRGIGDRVVVYGEWAGGFGQDLASRAIQELRRTGQLPARARNAVPTETGERFLSQLAVGLSYAGDYKDTTHLEYHFNQGGLDGHDWQRWLAAGRAGGPSAAAQFWAIRGYAREVQEPLAKHSLFVRTFRQDAGLIGLDLSGLADIDLQDGSVFVQAHAEYRLTDAVTAGVTAGTALGGRESEYGTLARVGGFQATLRYDF